MLDFNKKYEYHFCLHLRNNNKINIIHLSDNMYVDEVLDEFMKSNYNIINIVRKNKLIPGIINSFEIQYIEVLA